MLIHKSSTPTLVYLITVIISFHQFHMNVSLQQKLVIKLFNLLRLNYNKTFPLMTIFFDVIAIYKLYQLRRVFW